MFSVTSLFFGKKNNPCGLVNLYMQNAHIAIEHTEKCMISCFPVFPAKKKQKWMNYS